MPGAPMNCSTASPASKPASSRPRPRPRRCTTKAGGIWSVSSPAGACQPRPAPARPGAYAPKDARPTPRTRWSAARKFSIKRRIKPACRENPTCANPKVTLSMAYTVTASQIDDVVAVALDERLPEMMDTIYVKHVLFHRLDMDHRIQASGGNNILQPILYAKPPGGSYLGSGPFDITRRQTKSMLQFHWKQYYATLNIDGLTELQASGLNATFQIVDIELDACRMRLYEDLGLDVFLDGTSNNGAA